MGENFTFGSNDFNSDFSDRILRLEVTPDDIGGDDDHPTAPHKKLKGESNDSRSSDGAKVRNLRISSPILALKSPFFYKLFKNGMRESEQKNDVCLKIIASEEEAFIDLIRFMYGNCDLIATSSPALVDLLIAADKFEVTSCMVYCVGMLLKFQMSLESAISYLELPSSVLVSDAVKPLTDAAKQYVASIYRDFTETEEEAMKLPLSAIEVVIGSEGLQVVSEDVVFDFVIKWGRASYPELEERRIILTKHLAPLLFFSRMSVAKLKEVLACTDFDHESVSKLVIEALLSKVQLSCGQQLTCNGESKDRPWWTEIRSPTGCSSVGRVYSPHCVVFFDIAKNGCESLNSPNPYSVRSSPFRLCGQLIYLVARNTPRIGHDLFGLYVNKLSPETCILDIEFAVMKKSSRQFETKFKVKHRTLEAGIGCGESDLLGITWTEFMSDSCDYFINNVLHLRAELTLKNFKA